MNDEGDDRHGPVRIHRHIFVANESEVAGAYASYANCYIPKPNGFDELVDMVRSIAEFWFMLVQLPANEA
jgi:DNA-binding NarL/FixJ family response regulator